MSLDAPIVSPSFTSREHAMDALLEDLHWADDTSLDVIAALARNGVIAMLAAMPRLE